MPAMVSAPRAPPRCGGAVFSPPNSLRLPFPHASFASISASLSAFSSGLSLTPIAGYPLELRFGSTPVLFACLVFRLFPVLAEAGGV